MDIPVRLRTTKYTPPPVSPVERYRLALPPSYVQQVKWDAILERHNALATTPRGVRGRAVDDPVKERVVVLPADERERRDRTSAVFADMTPGKMPVIAVGGPGEHWQDLVDQVDEHRHYGEDVIPEHDRVDVQQAFRDRVEARVRWQEGTRTYGAQTRGLLDRNGR